MSLTKINFVSLDLETTGLDSRKDSIIEVGLVRFDWQGKILDRFNSLIYFDGKFLDSIASLTGISAKELLQAPYWEKVKREILQFVKDDDILIGHNINFDLSFLSSFGINWFDRKKLDSWYLATILISNARSYSLEYLLKIIGKEYQAHRALDDAEAVVDLYVYWQTELEKISDKVLNLLDEIAAGNNLPEGILYDLERRRRRNEGLEVKTNKNREEIFSKTKVREGSNRKMGLGINYLPMNFSELLKTNQKSGAIVVGSNLWHHFIRTLDCRNYDLARFDRRNKFLCKKFWQGLYKQSSFSVSEARVVIKILLKIDRGYWDGYLEDIMWFNEERDLAFGLGCRETENDHDCYFDRKIRNILRTDCGVILPATIVEQAKVLGKKNISIYSEDPLLEDGLTDLTGLVYDRDSWLTDSRQISDLIDKMRLQKKKVRSIDEWMEKVELLWRWLWLFVRSHGQKEENKIRLDVTAALVTGISFQNLSKQWVSIFTNFPDVFEELEKENLGGDLRKIFDNIFMTDTWLTSIVEYESGYWRLELRRKKFDMWLQNLSKDYSTIDLVNLYPASENNYFWRLTGYQKVNISKNIRPEIKTEIKNTTWVKYKQNIDWENPSSWLIVFNSKADMTVALEGLREEKNERKIFELGTKRGAWYYDLCQENFRGLVLSSYANLTELGVLEKKFDSIYLDRLPFDYPNKFVLAARAYEWQDDYFGKYFLPRMYQKLYYVFTLLKPGGKFFLGDDRWIKKNYVSKSNKLI
ncbi:MAG: PolC-type DNA polymerase III [Patescibacteria group bacterium]